MAHGQGNAEIGVGHGPTLTCNHEAPIVAHSLRGEGFDASEDGTGRGKPLVPVAIQERAVSENSNAGPGGAGFRQDGAAYTLEARHTSQAVAFDCKASAPQADTSGTSPTLRAMGHASSHANAGGQLAVAFDAQAGGKTALAAGDMAGALHGGGKHGGRAAVAFDMRGREGGAMPEGPHRTANIRAASGGSSRRYVALPWAVRRLTPRECERLQGFPDDFTLVPAGNKLAADGPRYKALGNSMAVNVMEWIGARIDEIDQWGGYAEERARA